MKLQLENTICSIVENVLPRYKEESNNKLVKINLRYSRMWFLGESPDEVKLTKDEIEQIKQKILNSGLPISFNGWSFESDVNYGLIFLILTSSYYCFEHIPEAVNKTRPEIDWEGNVTGETIVDFYDRKQHYENGDFCGNQFDSANWQFTTYHDSCWRDGAFRGMIRLDSAISEFMSQLKSEFNLGKGFGPYVGPNFTNLESIETYSLKHRFRGADDLYSSEPRHMFFLVNNEIIWIDINSPEFRELVKKYGNIKENITLCNPTSCELGFKTDSMVTHKTISRSTLKDILKEWITNVEK